MVRRHTIEQTGIDPFTEEQGRLIPRKDIEFLEWKRKGFVNVTIGVREKSTGQEAYFSNIPQETKTYEQHVYETTGQKVQPTQPEIVKVTPATGWVRGAGYVPTEIAKLEETYPRISYAYKEAYPKQQLAIERQMAALPSEARVAPIVQPILQAEKPPITPSPIAFGITPPRFFGVVKEKFMQFVQPSPTFYSEKPFTPMQKAVAGYAYSSLPFLRRTSLQQEKQIYAYEVPKTLQLARAGAISFSEYAVISTGITAAGIPAGVTALVGAGLLAYQAPQIIKGFKVAPLETSVVLGAGIAGAWFAAGIKPSVSAKVQYRELQFTEPKALSGKMFVKGKADVLVRKGLFIKEYEMPVAAKAKYLLAPKTEEAGRFILGFRQKGLIFPKGIEKIKPTPEGILFAKKFELVKPIPIETRQMLIGRYGVEPVVFQKKDYFGTISKEVKFPYSIARGGGITISEVKGRIIKEPTYTWAGGLEVAKREGVGKFVYGRGFGVSAKEIRIDIGESIAAVGVKGLGKPTTKAAGLTFIPEKAFPQAEGMFRPSRIITVLKPAQVGVSAIKSTLAQITPPLEKVFAPPKISPVTRLAPALIAPKPTRQIQIQKQLIQAIEAPKLRTEEIVSPKIAVTPRQMQRQFPISMMTPRQMQRQFQVPLLAPRQIIVPKQIVLQRQQIFLRQIPSQLQIQRPIQAIPRFSMPQFPSYPAYPFLPSLPSFRLFGRMKFPQLGKQPKKYIPSLIAVERGIFGKAPKFLTGFEVRPFARARRKKRNKNAS